MAHAPQPRRSRKKMLAGTLIGVAAAPAIMMGVAGTAQAAELGPVADYVDQNVSDTEHEIGAVLDDLGLAAE